MEITSVKETDDAVFITLAGLLTRDAAMRNQDPLIGRCSDGLYKRRIYFNIADCHHVDSTGVEWLLTTHRNCEEAGGALLIHSPQKLVLDVLQMMRMDLVLNVLRTEQDALNFTPPSKNGKP